MKVARIALLDMTGLKQYEENAENSMFCFRGWWFGSCVDNLNGKWYDVQKPLCLDNYPDGIRWIRGGNYSLPKTIMEVMPNTGGWF